ncbi:MAG: hypothetical protein R3D57_18125 [Hyphomicrobiaceae bacterium]
MRNKLAATVMLGVISGTGPTAAADPVKSEYTTIELKRCKALPTDPEEVEGDSGAAWWCNGLRGYKLYLAEGDLRFMMAYGKRAREQRAATQTLRPFNSIFPDDQTERATLEWRMRYAKGKWVPFATILRYHTFNGDQSPPVRGQVLVVAKVGPRSGDEACHVAYVDALANPEANVLAQQAADETAESFDCTKEPEVIGLSGKSPM